MPIPAAVRVVVLTLLGVAFLGACSPAFNWRETHIKDTALVALLPCKPDQGARLVPLGGQDVELHMTGCDAGGATFAIAYAELAQVSAVPQVLAQWRAATLANMGASGAAKTMAGQQQGQQASLAPRETPLVGNGAGMPSPLVLVSAQGHRRDGSAVAMQGLWFAKGTQVFHAVVYADSIATETTEAFFSALKFQ
jgi:hypothetical protein